MPGSSPEGLKTENVETQVESATVEVEVKDDNPPAESSTADKGEGKGDLLSQVKAALEPKEKAPASDEQGSKSEEDPEADAKKDGEAEGDESDDLTEEEYSKLRPKTRKRIENLLRDRSERDAKLAEVEPKASQFDQIVRFVEEAGLNKDEVNDGFNVMRDLKRDPLKAYERLKPIFQQLQVLAGDALPEELQNAVNIGQITEAHARELVRSKSQAAIASSQMQWRDERGQQEQQRSQVQARISEVGAKVSEWERSQSKSDPDWKLKQPRVMELVELETLRRRQADPNFFPSPDEAVQIAKAQLEKVEKEFKSIAPKRKQVTAITEGTSPRATAQPKTMLEAAKVGLQRAAG